MEFIARRLALALACLSASVVVCEGARVGEVAREGVQVDARMGALVQRLLARHGKNPPRRSEIVEAGRGKVDLVRAAKRLEGRLPADVAGLLQMSVQAQTEGAQTATTEAPTAVFTEESMAKARKVLNSLIEKAWKEMDAKLIECKEFEDKNRGTFEQVMTDIARLAEQIADNEKNKAQAIEEILVKDREMRAVVEKLKMEYAAYMRTYYMNFNTITSHRNDMAVFQFMVTLTKCPTSAAAASAALLQSAQGPKICEDEHGLRLDFEDTKAQAELERRMTPTARQELITALRRVQSLDGALIQEGGDADATTTTTTAGAGPTPPASKKVATQNWAGTKNWVKAVCTTKPPDCGLLNDNMSLLWGKFKDDVDELQMEMDKNAYEWRELQVNLNQQLEVLRTAKARFILQLNEAIANLNADREEMGEKEEERNTLEHEYSVYMKQCKKRIEWIMFQDICAFLSLRAAVMRTSTTCAPKQIVDCDWTAWTPGDCKDSRGGLLTCDDSCPDPEDPYACGGWQALTREYIDRPNECGFACPANVTKRKCGQVKCPVPCVMSKWSGWSKCSKECEGGVMGRTRSILTQPLNGGQSCNTAQESRACNTGSCDRNCRLKNWSKWSPCSVACGGGFQERWRRVLIPIRGQGMCPKTSSNIRYGIKKCNTFDCNGDEICIATQDLVMAIDASGSLRESGFKIVKGFASKLVERYKGEYYGHEDMRIGVVQFGNGFIKADGTVSEAILVQTLTSTMADVKTAVDGLAYKKGFTNMAQAFTIAEKMFLIGGRREAQSAVLTITDGKPSFLFQTYQKVTELKDKHVKLFFAPITEFGGDEIKVMKRWASSPWPTHMVHIPGLEPLAADEGIFVQRALVKFCPQAMSPAAMAAEEAQIGYLLVREGGYCGSRFTFFGERNQGVEECASKAKDAGMKAFVNGVRWARGYCWASDMVLDDAKFKAIQENRATPPCATGWAYASIYDMYVLAPAGAV